MKMMKNAHVRMGSLELARSTGRAASRIKVHLDRFIGEHPATKGSTGRAHLISVFGSDQEVAAIWAAVAMQETFTIEGPSVTSIHMTLGENAESFRGSLMAPDWTRPLRHLVALSKELAQVHLSDDDEYGRAIVCEADPVFVLYRLSERLGLPVVPDWAAWMTAELKRGQKIHRLVGIGCRPVVVYGTKESFLRMISSGITKRQISIPSDNISVHWDVPSSFVTTGETSAAESASVSR
jgi:hypothetical protein